MAPAESTAALRIDSLAHGPYGIGRKDGKVILVPLTAPGDEVEIRVREQKRNYAVGELIRLLRASPARQPPPCPYVPQCGGCPWQHMSYEVQIEAKTKNVEDALRRIGRLQGFELLPIMPSPNEYGYRGRIRLHADRDGRLGFHRAFSREVIEIESCLIADRQVSLHIGHAGDWLKGLKTQVKEIGILSGEGSDRVVFAARAVGEFFPEDDGANLSFLERHKEVAGLILFGRSWRRRWGETKIRFQFDDNIKMDIDGEVFSQVNRETNRHLVRELLLWGEFCNRDRVLELYSGAGNFTLPIARRSAEVAAVEADALAVENGIENSRLNGFQNIRWIRSSAPAALRRMMRKKNKFSKVILDPPRSGAKGLEEDLAALGAEKILYVSCDPTTLARDLAALAKKEYRLTRVRPFDLFPHTFHVEALAEMVRF